MERIKTTIATIIALTMFVPLLNAADNKEANAPDLAKRIVYSVDGMKNVSVRNVVYKTDGETKLQMNVYSSSSLPANKLLPIVLFVHGGPILADMPPPTEWGAFKSYGELVAVSGFVGVTFNHRFESQNDHGGRSPADVLSAIDYVRAHAKELHGDSDRIAVWMFSSGGPHLSWILRDRPAGVRCALAFYSLLDMRPLLPQNAAPATVAAIERLSAAAQLKEHGKNLPLLIARAGLDSPTINVGVDQFVKEALSANANIEVLNHPEGRHGFDVLDDNDRSREIIKRSLEFLKTNLQ